MNLTLSPWAAHFMFSHIMLGADDVEASKKFYDAALGELGVRPGRVDPKGRAMYIHDGSIFMLTQPIDGNPTTHANGSTYGFTAASPEAADAFHKAGVAAGGTAVEETMSLYRAIGFYIGLYAIKLTLTW